MKKILILTVCNPLEGSGIEKVMNEVGKTLGKSGKYKVTYLFSGDGKIEENDGIIYKSVKIPKIKGINYILYDLKLPKYIRNENPDLIIDNMGNSYFYQLFGKRRKNKILSVCHGTPRDFKYLSKHPPYNSIFDKIFNWFGGLSGIITHTYSIKKSDYIVTLSKELKTRLIDNGVPENKIHIIYNGYDPKDIEIKQHDGIKILFISNDHIRKGIDILENVANYYIKNDNIKFYVIGKSYESLHKNVISKGKMKRDELYNFMAESDIIFLPSYCEGQPLVVLEAMGFGCIPVISKECHMDILYGTPFEKYINNDNSVQRYITEINDILDNKSEQNLHETAKKIISDFTWDIQSQKYLSLIDKYI